MKDWLLAFWIFCGFTWDIAIIGFAAYVVFWLGRSPWWFVPAVFLSFQPTLFKALAKRFEVEA